MKPILYSLILCITLIHPTVIAKEQHIYLSRHAEKISDSRDPGLTDKGKNRSRWLASFLQNKSIEVIYSTNYKRTLQTAMPVVKTIKKSLHIYDPNKLTGLAKKILSERNNSVIIGHSNTTLEMVKLLGGNPGEVMSEKQYDRLFHLYINDDGMVTTEEISSEPKQE